jgi:hypothetical protein
VTNALSLAPDVYRQGTLQGPCRQPGRCAPCCPDAGGLAQAAEIDSYAFPPDCCIKSTHASGHVLLRRNNEPVDRDMIKRWTTIDYYHLTREPNYRGLERKIIVEPIIFPGIDLIDYRFICVDGEPCLSISMAGARVAKSPHLPIQTGGK